MKKISRRTVLFNGLLASVTATAGLLGGTGQAAAKVAPNIAGYRNAPQGNRNCANCRLFIPQNNSCQMVAGTFSPNGWCRFWR